MFHRAIRFALIAGLLSAFAGVAQAQTAFDTEIFRITIQEGLTIQAPASLVSQLHDETDADQTFPTQVWLVTANNNIGATVTFETNQAFTHTTDPTYKRDATIAIGVASGAAWTVTSPTATTDYANGLETVSVAADSDVAGDATFNVDVTFVEETFADLAAGDYEMTVTGTLTAK